MKDIEKLIGQKRIWTSKAEYDFSEEFIGRIFKITGHKTDMNNEGYFTYAYMPSRHDNRRTTKEILEHSIELSPVMKELFD